MSFKRLLKIFLLILLIPIAGLLLFSVMFSGGLQYLQFEVEAYLTPDKVMAEFTCTNGTNVKLISNTKAIPGNTLETNLPPELKSEDYLHVYQGGTEVLVFFIDARTLGLTGSLHWDTSEYSRTVGKYNSDDSEKFFAPTKICLSEASKKVTAFQPFYDAMQKYLPNNKWPQQ